jgi:protein-disulfide isomerase
MQNKKVIYILVAIIFVGFFYYTTSDKQQTKPINELVIDSNILENSDLAFIKNIALEELSLGNINAPVTIIEYASMTCSHCAEFHNTTFQKIKMDYIESGEVKYIFREFPIDKLAMATSMLTRCVDKNVSLPFIEVLFKTRDQWISENALSELKNLSKQAGLNNEEFDKCLNNQTLLDELISIKDQAITDYNINSTPSFIINGKVITGNKPYSTFKEEIDKVLESYRGI